MADKIKLKPCPFCGKEVELIGPENPFIICCKNCGLEFGHEKEYKMYQIVEAWNRRANND